MLNVHFARPPHYYHPPPPNWQSLTNRVLPISARGRNKQISPSCLSAKEQRWNICIVIMRTAEQSQSLSQQLWISLTSPLHSYLSLCVKCIIHFVNITFTFITFIVCEMYHTFHLHRPTWITFKQLCVSSFRSWTFLIRTVYFITSHFINHHSISLSPLTISLWVWRMVC